MVIRPQYLGVVLCLSVGLLEGQAQPNGSVTPPEGKLAKAEGPVQVSPSSQATAPPKKTKGARAQSPQGKARAISIKLLTKDHPLIKTTQSSRQRQARARLRKIPLTQPLPIDVSKTTSCELFLSNLDHKLSALKRRYQRQPTAPQAVVGYASQLYARGQIYGDLDEVAQALKIVETGLKTSPNAVKLRLLRAQIASTLHRVDITRRELNWIRSLFVKPPYPQGVTLELIRTIRADLELETGQNVAAHLSKMEREYQSLSFDGFVRAARAREQKGQVTLAQRYYGQAERHFTDVAPIPIAWLNVQRGLMAMHSGDFKSAHVFFKTAYTRCPQYPMAAEHLAEIEGRLGHFERSVELYKSVIQQTQNPEFMVALAELYLEHKREADAQALIKKARTRFDALERRYPNAMSGHVADFFLGLGEAPSRALKLLLRNYKLRPNARSAQVLADALISAQRLQEATPLVKQTLESPIEFAEKHWTAARLALALGQKELALKHQARARTLNPRIVEFEGELAITSALGSVKSMTVGETTSETIKR
jgi:tetratricopeptide (TPR) repeat protein